MSIKNDKWIRSMCYGPDDLSTGMIEPYVESLTETGIISYGQTSFGYDLRAGNNWKVFSDHAGAVIDVKNLHSDYFLDYKIPDHEAVVIPPNSYALTHSKEYIRMPRNITGVCVGKSTYARCFSGDTRVSLVDGSALSFRQMVEKPDELYFGYTYENDVRVGLLEAPRWIGREGLLAVTLDNGQVIECTHDHELLTKSDGYVRADKLLPGTPLRALYRRNYRGYEGYYSFNAGQMRPTYRLSDDWNLRNEVYDRSSGDHRHHKDHNKSNNNPWNIERKPARRHITEHNAEFYGPGFDAEKHGSAVREAFQKIRNDDIKYREFRERSAQAAYAFWHLPQYKEIRDRLVAMKSLLWTAEKRAKFSEEQAARWGAHERRSASIRSTEMWERSGNEARRQAQAELVRSLNVRLEITEEAVRTALLAAGTIRGASRLLNCDRSVFRRFPTVMAEFKQPNHRVVSVKEMRGEHDVFCLTSPEDGNFALDAGVFVRNCGIHVNVTPLEAEWEGHVTIEISNGSRLPVKVYAGEGIVQVLFFEGDQPMTSYADRKGKYQGQTGVTMARIKGR